MIHPNLPSILTHPNTNQTATICPQQARGKLNGAAIRSDAPCWSKMSRGLRFSGVGVSLPCLGKSRFSFTGLFKVAYCSRVSRFWITLISECVIQRKTEYFRQTNLSYFNIFKAPFLFWDWLKPFFSTLTVICMADIFGYVGSSRAHWTLSHDLIQNHSLTPLAIFSTNIGRNFFHNSDSLSYVFLAVWARMWWAHPGPIGRPPSHQCYSNSLPDRFLNHGSHGTGCSTSWSIVCHA